MNLIVIMKKAKWFLQGGGKRVAVNQFDGLNNDRNFPAKSEEVKLRVIDALQISLEDSFLDAGCAHGDLIFNVLPYIQFAVGVDLAEQNLRQAIRRIGDKNNVKFFKADFKDLPLPNESFNCACCNASFMYVPPNERLQVLREFNRVLTEDGRLFLGDLIIDSNDRGWGIYMWKVSIAKMKIYAQEAGFEFNIYRQPDQRGGTVWWDALLIKKRNQ